MIGPHQGRELELMLAGEKQLAIFYDAIVEDQDISEEIIPERAFAPYVAAGRLRRFTEIVTSPKSAIPVKYVLFTNVGEEWRASAFFWMQRECLEGRRPFDNAYEYFVGRLLGYSEADIAHFIDHWHRQKNPRTEAGI